MMTTGPAHATAANTWLYAVVGVPSDELTEPLAGVAGEPVRLLAGPGLAAVAGSVPRAEFDEAALNAHIQDPNWLEQAVRDHHRVVCAVGRTHRLLPMRFATVCDGDARAVELLSRQRDVLLAALEHVTGRVEFGVKAWVAPRRSARRKAVEDDGDPDPTRGPGAAYLAQLRARRADRDRARQLAAAQVVEAHKRLAALAADWVEHPPQSAEATGREEATLLNSAYLVDDARADAFGAVLADIAADLDGVDLDLTGPWPPYSFADHRAGPSDGRAS